MIASLIEKIEKKQGLVSIQFLQKSLSSSFQKLYPFDEIQEAQALQTHTLPVSAGVLFLFKVFDSTLMLI